MLKMQNTFNDDDDDDDDDTMTTFCNYSVVNHLAIPQ